MVKLRTKELLTHASADIVVQLGVVWVGGARHRVHGKIFQNRKALEGGACHLWSQMVALKEPSAVALDLHATKSTYCDQRVARTLRMTVWAFSGEYEHSCRESCGIIVKLTLVNLRT